MSKLLMDDPSWELVSKAIDGISQQWAVRKDNGTVKFLRFDPEKAYPKHHHPDRTEWLYVVSGEMIAQIDDQVHRLREGEFAIFPVNSEHSLKAGSKGAVVLVVAIFENKPSA
ncbi:MAG: cupin domain-containing protein [Candidatus Thermoplasmatota archaeon]|nr:cupin domain-containing protein [Candidatus Thermoplasmatota archaeon]MDS0256548.1 cupin domain-containing protein [Thermoplasmatales archaeon AK]